jgi:putative endonuclease
MHYVYVIQSDQKTLYIGYTKDLKRRMRDHNQGGNRSTLGRTWRLIYYEAYLSEEDAQVRERRLKQHGQAKRFLKDRIQHSLVT